MQNIELTPLHILGFIYIAFAHQTDGEFTHDEQKIVWQKLKSQIDNEIPYVQFTHLMDDMTRLYKLKMNDDNIVEVVMELAAELVEMEWFVKSRRLSCLKDLKAIALADDKFMESEKKWINRFSTIWQINRRTLNRL